MREEVKRIVEMVLPEWAAVGVVYTEMENGDLAVYIPEEVAKWMVENEEVWEDWERQWRYAEYYIEPLESEGSSYYVVSE